MSKTLRRESQFELIRILAQVFIVIYHLFLLYVYPTTGQALHKAIWLPLHIGVPLFVLISGYFGIRANVKGFIKLIGMVFVLYVPVEIIDMLLNGWDFKKLITTICFIFGTHFWFIRAYVYLYLFAPIINKYFENINLPKRLYLIGILGLMAIYVGTIGFDPSLNDGKNLVNFLFLYVLGNCLRTYRDIWMKWNNWLLITCWIAFNLLLVFGFTHVGFYNRIINAIYLRLFFSYASPGLLLNAVLFFILIGKLNFRSRFVNHIAKSSLAIYMIHASYLLRNNFIAPYALYLANQYADDSICLFLYITILTVLIITGCVLIDNGLKPIWTLIGKVGDYCQNKMDVLLMKIR